MKAKLWSPAFSLLCLCTMAACSTTPVSADQAGEVPSDRVYMPEFLQQSAERTATIRVIRDKGFTGSGCSHDILVNGVKVLALRQGEGVAIYLAPGNHFLKLETGGGLCPNVSTSQNLMLSSGDKQRYRILLPSDGSLRLTREE